MIRPAPPALSAGSPRTRCHPADGSDPPLRRPASPFLGFLGPLHPPDGGRAAFATPNENYPITKSRAWERVTRGKLMELRPKRGYPQETASARGGVRLEMLGEFVRHALPLV